MFFYACIVRIMFHDRITGAKSYKYSQNIGTVLFEKSDYGKQCWTSEEFIILSSRRMFQDILPQVNVTILYPHNASCIIQRSIFY